eukprot:scaffold137244_cov99-Phaeocystis_antarctica.AAC.1
MGLDRPDEHRENRAEQRHQAAGAARHEEGVVAPQPGVDLLRRRAQTVGEKRAQGCAGEGGRRGDSA